MQFWVSVNKLINENSEKSQKSSWTCRVYILEIGHRKVKHISRQIHSLNHDKSVGEKKKSVGEKTGLNKKGVLLIYTRQSGKSSLFRSLRKKFEETDQSTTNDLII